MSLPITFVGFGIAMASLFIDSEGLGLVLQPSFHWFPPEPGTRVSTLIGYEFDGRV